MSEVAKYEGDASISVCRALTIWQPSLQDDIDKAIEEARLEAEAEKLFTIIEEHKRRIVEMDTALQNQNAETIRQLEEYREELSALFEERASTINVEEVIEGDENLGPMPSEEELERIHRQFNERHNEQMRKEAEDTRVKISDKVKKLFRKIAKITHPDKVVDINMHKLFIAAKAAYNQNDYESLQMIWRQATGKVSGLFKAMYSRLKELQALVLQRTNEKRAIEASDPYRMMLDYSKPENRPHVEKFYRKLLDQQIAQTLAAIRQLDPTRHQPKPSLTGKEFFIANEKTSVMGGISEDSPWSDDDDDGIAT